jgi:hypothetical protein
VPLPPCSPAHLCCVLCSQAQISRNTRLFLPCLGEGVILMLDLSLLNQRVFMCYLVPVHKVPGGNSGPKSEPAERAHNKFYKSRVPSQYFTLDIFILSATLPPRSPGPSGSPSPTRSGPEPLWIHPRPTRPRGTSQPPVHATGAGKPRPTVICCEVADKNQYNKLLGVVRITVQESGSDWFTTVNYLAF